jgi:hypothetical protein
VLIPMKTLARERDRVEILQRIRALTPQSLARWGRMSAGQMVCHLSDSFRMALGQTAATSSPRRGPLWRVIQGVLRVSLYLPLRVPRGLPTSPEIDQERQGTRPGEFVADVAQLVALMELLGTSSAGLDGRAHPGLGPLPLRLWHRWGYVHADHHLRQFGV